MTDKVAIVDVDTSGYKSALDRAFGLIDFDEKNISGKSILIKPNLCDLRDSKSGNTTDVCLVEDLVKFLQRLGPKRIAIVESNHWVATADEEFRRLGYNEMAMKNKVSLINISKKSSYKLILKGKRFNTIRVPKDMLQYDFFITVPKLKTHPDCYITCALKNQFGMNPQKYKSTHHAYLNEALYDLNRLYKPSLIVVDGNFVRIRDFVAKRVGLILVGKNPAAVDYVVAKLFGFKPERVPYLKYFLKHQKNALNLEIVGKKIDECLIKTNFQKPQYPSRLLKFSHMIFRASENFGKIEKYGKQVSNFLTTSANYLAGTPPHLLLPAIRRGYRAWRSRKE